MGHSASAGKCLTIMLITMKGESCATRHCALEVLGHAFHSEMNLQLKNGWLLLVISVHCPF